MSLIRKYWFYPVLAIAVCLGFFVAHLSYENVVQPNSPYMIVDKDAPSDYCPVGYEPVEMTGKPIEQGEKAMITCEVPESYAKYIHYPENWEQNALNPNATQGQVTKWLLYGILVLMIGFIAWRSVVLYKRNKNKKSEVN